MPEITRLVLTVSGFLLSNKKMYQTIHEQISVAGVYDHGRLKFTPKKIKWRQRLYTVDEITLTSDVKDGGVRQRFYSMVCGPNVYRVVFNRDTEAWWLEEVWCE